MQSANDLSSFLRQYASSTAGSLLGRAPAYLVPFVLVEAGASGRLADEVLLLLALAWFYPMVVSNVFVDAFVNEIERRKVLIDERRWAIISAVYSTIPALVSLFVVSEDGFLRYSSIALYIYVASFFGLLCSRRSALALSGDHEFRVGLFNVVRGLILIAMLVSGSFLVVSVLLAAAVAELIRWSLLQRFTCGPPVKFTLNMPEGAGQLVAGALLVSIALYVQRWILAGGVVGSLLWFEVADKIYSLVTVGLTLGLSGVLQKYITRMVSSRDEIAVLPTLRVGGGVGFAGAVLCVAMVTGIQILQDRGIAFSKIDMGVVYPLVVLMAISFVPASMTMVISRVFVAKNQAGWVLGFSLLSFVVVVLGSYVANLHWGVFGVVVVNVLNSFFVFSLFLARAVWRL